MIYIVQKKMTKYMFILKHRCHFGINFLVYLFNMAFGVVTEYPSRKFYINNLTLSTITDYEDKLIYSTRLNHHIILITLINHDFYNGTDSYYVNLQININDFQNTYYIIILPSKYIVWFIETKQSTIPEEYRSHIIDFLKKVKQIPHQFKPLRG